jgi:aspartate aminotransferase
MALLDPGDEAIIPDPGWVSYGPMVVLAGARPVPVRAADEDGFVPSPDAVAELLTPRTRMIILNSPSNPAGSVYPRATMKGLADLARDHDLVLVSDEIYEKILYDGEHVSPASLDGMFDRTVTVNGFSKTYAMTGWRLGWLVAPQRLLKEISKVQEHTITCATSFAQKAGIAALQGTTEPLQKMVAEFRARRDLIVAELAKIDRVTCFRPAGAFYVFPNFDVPLGDAAFAEKLLQEAKVAITPGGAFGAGGAGHQRLSYAASRDTITEAVHRIDEVTAKL